MFHCWPIKIAAPPNRNLTLLLGQVVVAARQTISVECCKKTPPKRPGKADQAEVRTRDVSCRLRVNRVALTASQPFPDHPDQRASSGRAGMKTLRRAFSRARLSGARGDACQSNCRSTEPSQT